MVHDAKEIKPIALIVQVDSSDDPASNRPTLYFAVVKLAPDEACVVGKVKQSATEARTFADNASGKPTLGPLH